MIADLEPANSFQPSCRILTLYHVDFDSVLEDHLPQPGTTITPELDAQFGGR